MSRSELLGKEKVVIGICGVRCILRIYHGFAEKITRCHDNHDIRRCDSLTNKRGNVLV